MPAASIVPVAEAPALALGDPVVERCPPTRACGAADACAVPLAVPRLFPAAPPVRSPAPEAFPIPPTVEPGPGSHFAPAES